MMSAAVELTYFDGRGLAEIIRLVLTAGEIKFTEVNLQTREQFLSLFPDLLFLQVPLLRIDGMNLVQSGAIVRYVARKTHLFGQTEQEAARIDVLYEGTRDFFRPFMSAGFTNDSVKDSIVPNLNKYLPIYNKVLIENGSNGFLVGSNLSLADLGLFETLLAIVDYCGYDALNSHPEIQEFFKKISSLGPVDRYLKGVRKPCNSPEYVSNVQKVLGRS